MSDFLTQNYPVSGRARRERSSKRAEVAPEPAASADATPEDNSAALEHLEQVLAGYAPAPAAPPPLPHDELAEAVGDIESVDVTPDEGELAMPSEEPADSAALAPEELAAETEGAADVIVTFDDDPVELPAKTEPAARAPEVSVSPSEVEDTPRQTKREPLKFNEPVSPKEFSMLNIDIAKLEQTVEDIKGLLRDGLKATDIFDGSTGLSLAGHNSQPEAVALFTLLTNEIQTTLQGSGFPGLARYYMLDMQDNNIVVLQLHDDSIYSGMLLDANRVNLGVLVSVAMPRYAAGVAAARVEG